MQRALEHVEIAVFGLGERPVDAVRSRVLELQCEGRMILLPVRLRTRAQHAVHMYLRHIARQRLHVRTVNLLPCAQRRGRPGGRWLVGRLLAREIDAVVAVAAHVELTSWSAWRRSRSPLSQPLGSAGNS